ncbi:alpha/beta fold hydrolase [Leifsonia sp. NPDC058292]|uniref:alpha/beta fold hydrolase n=1 Tax=Leifsonia sp. NPDC058292 TaxID=3346428 RepID=UPI0036DE4198
MNKANRLLRRSLKVAPVLKLAALRTTFAVLEGVAPEVGARIALDLWCTLPGNPGRRRDERPNAGTVTRLDVGGRCVVVETWGNGPRVYLVHGWGGWRGQLGQFIAPLVEAGFQVLAFDVPGHGDSGPSVQGRGRGNGVEFIQTLQAVSAQYGRPFAVVAHSYGGTITGVAIRDGLDFERLVCVSPSVDPMTSIRGMARLVGIRPRTMSRLLAGIERLAGRPLSDFDPRSVTRTRPRTLVIHDREDKEIPYSEATALLQSWPSAELFTTTGLGHQRILRDPNVISHAVEFLVAAP